MLQPMKNQRTRPAPQEEKLNRTRKNNRRVPREARPNWEYAE